MPPNTLCYITCCYRALDAQRHQRQTHQRQAHQHQNLQRQAHRCQAHRCQAHRSQAHQRPLLDTKLRCVYFSAVLSRTSRFLELYYTDGSEVTSRVALLRGLWTNPFMRTMIACVNLSSQVESRYMSFLSCSNTVPVPVLQIDFFAILFPEVRCFAVYPLTFALGLSGSISIELSRSEAVSSS